MDSETSKTVFLAISCIVMAVALSACCGFKVFVPPLVLSVFAKAGLLVHLGENYAWLATWPAIAVLGLATVVETVAYFVPAVNNALDTIKIPIAAIAGALTASAAMSSAELSPLVRWSMAIIVGGGGAAAVSAGMAGLRSVLTTTTAGVGSSIQNVFESIISFCLSILSILGPILIALAILITLIVIWCTLRRRRRLAGAQLASAGSGAP